MHEKAKFVCFIYMQPQRVKFKFVQLNMKHVLYMNMFARFNENPAMTLQDIKETKRYGWMDGRNDGRTDNVKTVYPLQTKFAGGITNK